MKTTLQKLGKSLSAMVMPNIGAFIAWGFITALFIADVLRTDGYQMNNWHRFNHIC